MTLLMSIVLAAWSTAAGFTRVDLDHIRLHYEKAVSDRQLWKQLTEALSPPPDDPLLLGYLGALQVIGANHTRNPFTKFSTFVKGKRNMEKAVKADPGNVELRFIRLSIQLHCPGFLGYNGAIAGDRQYIKDNLHAIQSAIVKEMCIKLL